MRRTAIILFAGLALLGAGCGGDDGGGGGDEGDATELLERGFATDVDTGRLTLDLEVELDGVDELDGPVRLELSGPFRSRGATELPDIDMELSASGGGLTFDGRLLALPENAWIGYEDETYEVGEELWRRALESLSDDSGPDTFAQAGVDPLDWVSGAETDGEEEVAGAQTTKVTGELDVVAMLRDFNEFVPAGEKDFLDEDALEQLDQSLDRVEFEAWIGDDDIWRRVASDTEFTVPEDESRAAGGLEGGRVSLDATLAAPNEPVSIEAPVDARPLTELLRALGIPPELILGPGVQVPQPG